MNWKLYALRKTTEWLLGGELFTAIVNLVDYYMNEDIPGEKKREEVFKRVRKIAGNTAIFLINLGIEVAVAVLKVKYQELNK